MTIDSRNQDVIVIGGGVIGCSIAYQCALAGLRPLVLDAGSGSGQASRAGAGMLGAQVEMGSPGPMFELGLRSRSMFTELAENLLEQSGIDIEFVRQGIVRIADTEQDRTELLDRLTWQIQRGCQAQWLEPADIDHWLGAGLLPTACGALYLPDDFQVRVPQLVKALTKAIWNLGGRIETDCPVEQWVTKSGKITAVATRGGIHEADRFVLAAGAWTGQLAGKLGITLPIFPIKGQSFFLNADSVPTPLTVYKHGAYVVPKQNGQLYVGATEEQSGFQFTPTDVSLQKLMTLSTQMMPSLSRYSLDGPIAGLRPASGDGLPIIGPLESYTNAFVAGGHFRNGVLLSAITGAVAAEWAMDQSTAIDLSPFSPSRFNVEAKAI